MYCITLALFLLLDISMCVSVRMRMYGIIQIGIVLHRQYIYKDKNYGR